MIDNKDRKYCKINQASEGIFPTYFLINLNLSKEQKTVLKRLISFLEALVKRHTPPPPKICPTCGIMRSSSYADTWGLTDHLFVASKVEILKKLLQLSRINGDHT